MPKRKLSSSISNTSKKSRYLKYNKIKFIKNINKLIEFRRIY